LLRNFACVCHAVAAGQSLEILPTPPPSPIEGEKGNFLDSSRRGHGATGRSGPRRGSCHAPRSSSIVFRLWQAWQRPAEVLSIVEGQPIAIVLSDVDLRPDDVVDSPSKRPCLGTRCRAGRAGRGRERRERFACARPRNRGVRVCAWFNSCNALITHDLVKSKQNEILLTYPGSPRV
jgi:hypothetical protein